jgi:hypothetical protein
MKKPINTRLHGIMDYTFGFILLLPWIVNYHQGSKDTDIIALTGAATIVLSLMTDYELSVVKVVPMKAHLFIDVLSGLLLIALPFLFPVSHYYLYWPVILGLGELLIVLLSSSKPFVVTKKDLNITRP